MKKIIYSMAIVMLTISSSWGQNTVDVNLLNGGWYAFDTNEEENILISSENKKSNPDYVLNFLSSSSVHFKEKENAAEYTYVVENDKLIVSNKEYLIIKLSSTELNLQLVGETKAIYFKKMKKYGY